MAPSDIKTTVSEWIDARREEILSLAADLIAARTDNPPGNEIAAARVVQQFFEKYDIEYSVHENQPNRTNIIGRVGRNGRSLFMAGHLDTVPAGEGWTTPPYQATIRDGMLYGRGAVDDKGPMACIALAGACLRQCFELDGMVLLAGVADEERGSAQGLEYLMDNGLLSADCGIIPDSAGEMREIDVAERGVCHFEIVSHGKQAHGSRPQLGVNAIWNLIAALQNFRRRGLPAAEHKLLAPPSYNLGLIQGGTVANVVPATATATLDIRYLPGQSVEQIADWLKGVLDETSKEIPDARFELKCLVNSPPTEVAEDHPLVEVVQRATREMTGFTPIAAGITGATVTKSFIRRGIPAIGFCPGATGMAHMADEAVSIEELVAFTKTLALSAIYLLGGRPAAKK